MNILNQDQPDIFSFEMDETAKSTFLEMTSWTKFLAIIGFIFMGIFIIVGFFVATSMSNMPALSSGMCDLGSSGIVLVYIILAALYFYPTYALLKYSTGMKAAMNTNDKVQFNQALAYLKNMFKYIGILMIIVLAIYGLVILLGLFAIARM